MKYIRLDSHHYSQTASNKFMMCLCVCVNQISDAKKAFQHFFSFIPFEKDVDSHEKENSSCYYYNLIIITHVISSSVIFPHGNGVASVVSKMVAGLLQPSCTAYPIIVKLTIKMTVELDIWPMHATQIISLFIRFYLLTRQYTDFERSVRVRAPFLISYFWFDELLLFCHFS